MLPKALRGRNDLADEAGEESIYQTLTPGIFEFPDPKEKYVTVPIIPFHPTLSSLYFHLFIASLIESRFLIKPENLEIGAKIGAGSFGEVRAGVLHGKKVAVKQLIRQKISDTALVELRFESALLRYKNKDKNIRTFTKIN